MSRTGFAKYRMLSQLLFFFAFIGLLLAASRQVSIPIPLHLFLLLDPLIAVIAFISGQSFAAITMYSLVTATITFLFGRVFCGYACPLGTIIELFESLSEIFNVKQKNFKKLRVLPLAVLAIVITLSVLNIGTAMIFDPISLTTRAATITIASFEAVLGQSNSNQSDQFLHAGNRGFGRGFGSNIDQSVGSSDPVIQASSGWILLFFAFIIGLNLLGKRFWCRYLCPLGGLLGLVGKIPIFRRKVDPSLCTGCMKCAKNCNMQAVANKGKATDAANCLLCLECADACPKNAISIGLKPDLTTEIPSRRTALAVIGGTMAAAVVAPLNSQATTEESLLIRPPGVSGEELFLSKCIRCGECVAACPTDVIQPAFFQQGIGSLWTPHMEFATGSCEYSCNECGKVCPTGAIEYLARGQKQLFPIGTAVIDENKCRYCGRCIRVCPVPGNAITMQINGLSFGAKSNLKDNGGSRDPQRLYNRMINVDVQKCIGCGICIEVCPVRALGTIKIVRNETGEKTSGNGQYKEDWSAFK